MNTKTCKNKSNKELRNVAKTIIDNRKICFLPEDIPKMEYRTAAPTYLSSVNQGFGLNIKFHILQQNTCAFETLTDAAMR